MNVDSPAGDRASTQPDALRASTQPDALRASTQPDALRASSEFDVLRATIRQRGTARMLLLPAAVVGWAALAIGTAAVITVALSTVIPLLVLVAAFEATFALYVNVERIGRYLQVFHERDEPGWEHVTMAFGERFPGGGDPLFTRVFTLATSVNFLPALLGGEPWEVAVVAGCHFAFLYRIRTAQRLAASCRAEDLAKFRALRDETVAPAQGPPPSSERPTD